MRGFQLWLNLPSREKMTTPSGTQEFGPRAHPDRTPRSGCHGEGHRRQHRRHRRADSCSRRLIRPTWT